MLKAFVYLFVIYGMFCLIYFNLKLDRKHTAIKVINELQEGQIFLAVKVRDAENDIEALVREYVKLGHILGQPHKLMVIDTGSKDQTVEILKRLTYRYPYLTLAYEQERILGRKVVVEYTARKSPKQTVKHLAKICQQEFST